MFARPRSRTAPGATTLELLVGYARADGSDQPVAAIAGRVADGQSMLILCPNPAKTPPNEAMRGPE